MKLSWRHLDHDRYEFTMESPLAEGAFLFTQILHVSDSQTIEETAQSWAKVVTKSKITVPIFSPGYHCRTIVKGIVGEGSKIVEEALEFEEALEQKAHVMALVELSDLYGAMESYLQQHHPSLSMDDLKKMSHITQRAFKNGRRD